MKQNELDNFFRDQLLQRDQLPKGINFRKERMFEQIENKIKKPQKKNYAFASVIILLLLSGFWNAKQFFQINQQQERMDIQTAQLESNQSKLQLLVSNQNLLQDSLQQLKVKINRNKIDLPDFSGITSISNICMIQFPIENKLIEINTKRIQIEKESVPEPDLPIYYESDYLLASSNAKKSNSKSGFIKKLSSQFNN